MRLRDCLSCFRCCIPHDQGGDSYLQPLNIFQPKSNTTIEELLEQSSQAREAMWKRVGSLEPMVLSHTVNPASTGGPKWPAHRQAFRVIKRPNGNVILASDGLSDPFDDIAEGSYVPHQLVRSLEIVVHGLSWGRKGLGGSCAQHVVPWGAMR